MNMHESGSVGKQPCSGIEEFLRATHADQGGEAKFERWVRATADDAMEFAHPEAVQFLRLWGDLRNKNRGADGQWILTTEDGLENGKLLFEQALTLVGGDHNEWCPSAASISPWEYCDVWFNGASQAVRVGVSAGGVVSIDGHPFTPDRETEMNVEFAPVVKSLMAACLKVGSRPRVDATTALAGALGLQHEQYILKMIRDADSPDSHGNGYLVCITTDQDEFFRGAVRTTIQDIEQNRVLILDLWEPRMNGGGQTGLELKVPLQSIATIQIEW